MTRWISLAMLGLLLSLAGCSCIPFEGEPKDDTSEPADGETGGAACEAELEELRARIIELEKQVAECKAAGPS